MRANAGSTSVRPVLRLMALMGMFLGKSLSNAARSCTGPSTQPAVATWKAVAETLSEGLSGIPQTAVTAMIVGGLLGVLLSVLERRVSGKYLTLLPSGATVGLAFVIPASTSITLFLGALFGALLYRFVKHWAQRFLLSLAAGLVAGESLYGVIAVWF